MIGAFHEVVGLLNGSEWDLMLPSLFGGIKNAHK